MDGSLAWRARYDELEERLRSAGTQLADRSLPESERDEVSDEFIRAWQQFCETIKQQPESPIDS